MSQHAARMEDGGFTIITHRRGRGKKHAMPATAAHRATNLAGFRYSGVSPSIAMVDEATITNLGRRIEAATTEVRASPFYSGLIKLLRDGPRPIDSIVCLGVGNFASQYSARCQLALAMLLREDLLAQRSEPTEKHAEPLDRGEEKSRGVLHLFDPMFDALEQRFLELDERCYLRPRNEEGRVRVHPPGRRCLFLLPHCPRQLYSNILEANWGPIELPNVLVLGNSFGALADALDPSERESTRGWCRVTRCAHLATEHTCEQLGGKPGEFDHAFANTSLHIFDAAAMPPDGDAIWARAFEPAPKPSDKGLLGDG